MNLKWFNARLFSGRSLLAILTLLLLCGVASLRADIFEYEGFDYSGTLNTQNGGTGWGGVWTNTDNRAVVAGDALSLTFPPSVSHVPEGSRIVFDATGSGKAERRLGTTMSLSNESVFYLSALVKRQGDFRFEFMDNANNVRWRFGAAGTGSTNAAVLGVANDAYVNNVFPINETVILVAKMVAHQNSSTSDQVYLNVYRASDTVPVTEPTTWQASGGSASSVILTRLQIRNISSLPLEVDEVRVGTNYLEVSGAVAAGPPVVTLQPVSTTTTYQGLNVQFFVEAGGQVPLFYQWFQDETPLAGATDAVLLLTNVQAAQAGSYAVLVSNAVGAVVSDPAVLHVIPVTGTPVGLQALWHFDETSGLVAHDATANHNDGVLAFYPGDDSQWVPSDYNGALSFRGSNWVEVPNSPSLGAGLVNRFTVTAWMRSSVTLSTNGNLYRTLEKEGGYFLLQGDGNLSNLGSGGMNVVVKKGGANIPASIWQALNANTWYHIAATYDGAALRIYLDGQLKDTRAVAAPLDSTSLPLHIGSDYMATTNGTKYFNGLMDEVGIWDRPLSVAEILELAGQNGVPVVVEQPQSVARYPGSTATFQVRARGQGPFRYLWYKGDTEIRSATSNVLVLANIQPDQAGEYRCRISNDLGDILSEAATLTVIPVTGINDALQALWRLDETSGLAATDSSGNGREGSLVDYTDGSQWIAGQVNNALSFDGQSNRVVVTNSGSLNVSPDATFAFWLRPTNYGTLLNAGSYFYNQSRVIRKGSHFDIELVDDPGSVRATLRANGVPAPQQNLVQLNTWQHFTVVFAGGMVSFYKNGFLVGAPVPGNIGSANSSMIVLGNVSENVTNVNFFAGAMDEVGIWTRPLSETEIMTVAGRDVSGQPVIVTPPQSSTRYVGSSVSFLVEATGQRPLSYTWMHNGTPIPDSNTNQLTLSALSVANGGEYTVRVQNGVGSAVSAPAAVLTVLEVTNLTTGLIAYWTFDETNGTVLNDVSGHGHNAAIQNASATAGVAGVIGGAFNFDGANDYAIVPHAPELNLDGQATISVWINPRTLSVTGDRMRIVRKDINFDLTLLSTGSRFMVYGLNKAEYLAPVNSVTNNEWQHLAVVIKDGTIQLFKNGRALAEPVPGVLGPAVTNDLFIGNFSSNPSIPRYFNGYMDDLGIWDRALSLAEIDGIYQNGLAGRSLDQPFVPFRIESNTCPTPTQVRLVFSTPYNGREHAIQRNNDLSTTNWTAQPGVTFNDLGGGLLEALFEKTADVTAFYRVALAVQADLFFEDFETGAPGWTHGGAGDNWQAGVPVNGPGRAVSGTNVYATSLTGNIQPYSDSYLRSPAIELTGVSRATLSFQQWRNIDPDSTFQGTIVNVLDASNMSVIQQLSLAAGATSGYELSTIQLPPQALGRSIILEFRLYCDAYNLLEGWYIDDVRIVRE